MVCSSLFYTFWVSIIAETSSFFISNLFSITMFLTCCISLNFCLYLGKCLYTIFKLLLLLTNSSMLAPFPFNKLAALFILFLRPMISQNTNIYAYLPFFNFEISLFNHLRHELRKEFDDFTWEINNLLAECFRIDSEKSKICYFWYFLLVVLFLVCEFTKSPVKWLPWIKQFLVPVDFEVDLLIFPILHQELVELLLDILITSSKCLCYQRSECLLELILWRPSVYPVLRIQIIGVRMLPVIANHVIPFFQHTHITI